MPHQLLELRAGRLGAMTVLRAGPTSEPDFLHVTKGPLGWLLTLDSQRIGMMYLFAILGSLIAELDVTDGVGCAARSSST